MNDHDRAARLAAIAIDFPLSAGERRELDAHLRSCLTCRAYHADVRSDASSLAVAARRPAPLQLRAAVAEMVVVRGDGRSAAPAFQLAWRLLVLAALLAILSVSLLLIGAGLARLGKLQPDPLHVSGSVLADPGVVLAEQPPGPHPGGGSSGITGAAFGEGSVWVTSGASIERIDPSTNALVATVGVGAHPTRIAFGAGAVWVSVTGADEVARVDPRTNTVSVRIPVGRQPVGIAFSTGSVWVASRQDQELQRIDPATNRVVATIPLASSPLGVDATPGSIWVTSDRGSGFSMQSSLVQVDASSNAIVRPNAGGSSWSGASGELVADGKSVWFLVPASLDRLDVATNQVTASIPVHNASTGLALGGGSVWVFSSQGFVDRIDPATDAVAAELTIALPDGLWNISGTYGAGAAWVRSYETGAVIRIDGR